MLKGKKVIILGERDHIPGDTIQTVLGATGIDIVYVYTQCFV